MTATPHTPQTAATEPPARLHGLLVEFADERALLAAARRVRESGYTKIDAHSPYPVHGIDAALGIRSTRLPLIVFACGAVGALAGVGLQWWTNASDATLFEWLPNWARGYSYRISGKPFWSVPANIPVIFELTVLLAALAAVFGMLVLNNLPNFYHALFTSKRFARVTDDRFFLSIAAADPRFDEPRTLALAESLGGTVERVYDVPTPPLPQWVKWVGWIVISLALLPPAFVAKARVSKSELPRIHPILDMDNQPRYKSQQAHPLFADGRASRPKIVGTVARGDWPVDPHYQQGGRLVRDEGDGQLRMEWFAELPAQVPVNLAALRRGQERYIVHCAPCHGLDGRGQGIINQRALALQQGWIPATDLHSQTVREREHGHLFNTITHGIRSMPGYGHQVSVEDRWNIVLYVRALQRSTQGTLDDVPAEKRGSLR